MDTEALHAGSVAPDFTLPDQNGAHRSLTDYRGRWVFLCFYTKDDLVGCIKEICALRDHFKTFEKLGITILGISADSIENHKLFTEEYHIPFALLTDAHKKIAKRYEVLTMQQTSGDYEDIPQISILINLAGQIEKIYTHVNPARHASEVLADVMEIQKEDQDGIEL